MLITYLVVEVVVTVAGTWVFAASSGRVHPVSSAPVVPTAIVLGSKVTDGEPLSYLRGRLDTAAELYRTGRVRTLLDSGNGGSPVGDEVAVMRTALLARGIPGDRIVDDGLGLDTAASCRRAHDVYGVRRAVVVTQDFHVGRAVALCRTAGIDASGVVADCACATWTVLRNHLRELLLARPRALVSALSW
ncbi:DUF218 domain-containing protein [Williamsia sterculiae]|uniref:DUF218 domain-containing protein n=2 Tax=Williamsia sterculiae TaxID=1344003 RepID=A0A1N7CJ27_9NOCA|nr:DUF218 domain-containing protein [Williamsia sterculiae]